MRKSPKPGKSLVEACLVQVRHDLDDCVRYGHVFDYCCGLHEVMTIFKSEKQPQHVVAGAFLCGSSIVLGHAIKLILTSTRVYVRLVELHYNHMPFIY